MCQMFRCANSLVCQMLECVKYSSVPILWCAKFLCVPNVQVCQQEQQLHKRRRSIKSPFTCFACLALPGPGQTVLTEWSFGKSSSSERKWNFSEEEKGKSNWVKSLKTGNTYSSNLMWGHFQKSHGIGLWNNSDSQLHRGNRGRKNWNSSRHILNTLTKLSLQQSSFVQGKSCRIWHMGIAF